MVKIACVVLKKYINTFLLMIKKFSFITFVFVTVYLYLFNMQMQ